MTQGMKPTVRIFYTTTAKSDERPFKPYLIILPFYRIAAVQAYFTDSKYSEITFRILLAI